MLMCNLFSVVKNRKKNEINVVTIKVERTNAKLNRHGKPLQSLVVCQVTIFLTDIF